MQCMKCGREIANRQVFCEECLAEMEKYPVKPGTVVQLPPRPRQTTVKKSNAHRRPERQPKEKIKILRWWVGILSLLLAVTLTLLIGLSLFTADYIKENKDKLLPGQNYSVAEDTRKSANR